MASLKSLSILVLSIAVLSSASCMSLVGAGTREIYLEPGAADAHTPPLHQLGETPFTSVAAKPRQT